MDEITRIVSEFTLLQWGLVIGGGLLALMVIIGLARWAYRAWRDLFTLVYLAVIIVTVYVVITIFFTDLPRTWPRPSAGLTVIWLVIGIITLSFWQIHTIPFQVIRWATLLASIFGVLVTVLKVALPAETLRSFSLTALEDTDVNPTLVLLAAIIAVTMMVVAFFVSRRRTEQHNTENRNIDERRQVSEHHRDEKDYRISIDERQTLDKRNTK
jgi:hypothetical protein